MKRLILLSCLAAVASCSKKTDYSEVKRNVETVTEDGVTYTIEIPDGLPKDDRNVGDWSNAKEEYDHVPHVFTHVSDAMPDDLESAKYSVALKVSEATFVRAEKRPDGGYALTDAAPDKSRVEASTFTKVGAKVVKCSAVQNTDGGELPSYEKTKAMLEAICNSVKAK
jgi:hypothetical protein